MHANLVRTAGLKLTAHERYLRTPQIHHVERLEMRTCLLTAGRLDDGHAGAVARITADRRIDGGLFWRFTPDQRQIGPLDRARLQLTHEIGLCGQRAGDDHQAGGFFIETVHDARARQLSGIGIAMQQAVEHRAAPVACSRVHNQAGRLVDDEQRVVFVDDIQVDRLSHEGVLIGRALRHDLDASAAGYRCARAHRSAIHAHSTGVDPLLQAAARVIGQQLGQRLI